MPQFFCVLGVVLFFFFFRLGLQTSVSVCRLLLQPLSSLPASPGLFPTAEGSGTRPQQREANYLQVHPLKKKKKLTLTYTDTTTSSHSQRLKTRTKELLGMTSQEDRWSKMDRWWFHFYFFYFFVFSWFYFAQLESKILSNTNWTGFRPELVCFVLLRRSKRTCVPLDKKVHRGSSVQ